MNHVSFPANRSKCNQSRKAISSMKQIGKFVVFPLKNACNESQAAGPVRLRR